MIRRLEVQAKQKFERQYVITTLRFGSRGCQKATVKEIANAAENGDPKAVAKKWLEEEVREPTRRRYITNDRQ